MVTKKDCKILEEVLKETDEIEGIVAGLTFEQFNNNEVVKRAIAMTLINIGEYSRRLSAEFRKSTDIPFKRIIGLRDIAAHGYGVLRFNSIWTVIKTDIPDLKTKIEKLLAEYC